MRQFTFIVSEKVASTTDFLTYRQMFGWNQVLVNPHLKSGKKGEKKVEVGKLVGGLRCLSLCYLGAETGDHHRNPNINTDII